MCNLSLFWQITLIVILDAQIFAAGMSLQSDLPYYTAKERVKSILFTLYLALFGITIIPLIIILAITGFIHHQILNPLNVNFIIKIILLKRPLIGYNEELQSIMREKADKQRGKAWYNLKARSFVYCTDWVTKNYDHKRFKTK